MLVVLILGNSFVVKGLATCVVASGLPRAGGHDRRFCFVRDLAACVTALCLPSVGDHGLRLTSCWGREAYVPTSGLPGQSVLAPVTLFDVLPWLSQHVSRHPAGLVFANMIIIDSLPWGLAAPGWPGAGDHDPRQHQATGREAYISAAGLSALGGHDPREQFITVAKRASRHLGTEEYSPG